ncbi:ABC transporter permease [Tundrisphaera sp. TA3]|uniref:ABC transporter permease n=1 Tax=Tundrisphaera sp. TA3 TaxID=3435775 RepID=UPI003EBDACD3
MWSFAWRNLITRPTRTTLAVVGLTIPVLAFLGLFSITAGIRQLMGSTLGTMHNLMVLRENSPAPVFSDLPADLGPKLRAMPGVRVAAPEVWRIAPAIDGKGGLASGALGLLTRPRDQGLKGLITSLAVQGQDIPEHLKLRNTTIPNSILPQDRGGGRFLELSDIGKPNIVISVRIAREHPNADGTPKAVGQTMRIGTRDFTIIGLYDTGSLFLDSTIVMDIGVARELLGVSEAAVSTFNVEPADMDDADALMERIMAAHPGVTAQPISKFNITVGEVMGKLDQFLLAAVALALLVGGVGIGNTMVMSTSERYVEFGVMRTNGWTRRNIMALVTAESALLGIISGAIAVALAFAAVLIANRLISGFSLELSPKLLAVSLAAALGIATGAGLYPAWRASLMTPMAAIRRSATT